jgi:DNA topoisomerase
MDKEYDSTLDDTVYGRNSTSTIDRDSALALIGLLKRTKEMLPKLSFDDIYHLISSTRRSDDSSRFANDIDLNDLVARNRKNEEDERGSQDVKIEAIDILESILDDLLSRLRQTIPLRALGVSPGRPVTLHEGYYVTDGEVSASLDIDDNPHTITLERALELLASKRG